MDAIAYITGQQVYNNMTVYIGNIIISPRTPKLFVSDGHNHDIGIIHQL